MSTISKRDAMQLVEEIRRANLGGHAVAARHGGDPAFGFLVGLEIILQHFLRRYGCSEAAEALSRAMNDTPTEAEIAARNADIARWSGESIGSASHG